MDTKEFLKEHAVYQIYPISFCDSDGDGKGDLKGIVSKLDYIQSLGIRIIWLSPIYASPMKDFGYDISDYKSVNPLFGTMEDFDLLMEETKKRGIRVVMDLVVNHTSDQHPWFKEALKDKNSKYRDYYIFREGKKDKKGRYLPPNNWTSNFTGPAWEEVEGEEGMFYLHIFTKQQPDLNWKNPAVLREVEDIMRFWMDKGVYGFRCDVISEIYKTTLEDGKPKAGIGRPVGMEHYLAQEGNHRILKTLRKDVIDPRGGVLIGECGGNITPEDGRKFLDGELDTFFEFDYANCYKNVFSAAVSEKKLKKILIRWQKEADWNGNYLENHDQRRVFGHYVRGKYADYGAKMLLVLLYTLRGTPFIYMGQEYGAHNYPRPLKIRDCQDIVTQNVYRLARSYHVPSFLASKIAHKYGRDDERAPMAFHSGPGYGFSAPGVTPWEPYNPYSSVYNAEKEEGDKDSILSFFKKVNLLREENKVLSYGSISFDEKDPQKDVLSYERKLGDRTFVIVLNLSNKKRKIPESVRKEKGKKLLLTNYQEASSFLRPYEALVFLK